MIEFFLDEEGMNPRKDILNTSIAFDWTDIWLAECEYQLLAQFSFPPTFSSLLTVLKGLISRLESFAKDYL